MYTYRNKNTGEVIHLNHRAKSVFWEEVEPEQEDTLDEDPEQDAAPKKPGRGRGKKE